MYNKLLDSFYCVAHAGSFNKAAQELFVTPSAVLQQIRSLETDLGVTLFERSSRGVAATAAGSYLLEQCQEAREWDRRVRARLAELAGIGRSVVRIGESYLLRALRLVSAWPGFSVTHPGMSMSVTAIDRGLGGVEIVDLLEGPVNVSVELERLGFRFVPLDDVELGVAMPYGSSSAIDGQIEFSELAGKTVVSIGGMEDEGIDEFESRAVRAGAEIRHVDVYTPATLSECALNGWALQVPMCWDGVIAGLHAVAVAGAPRISYGVYLSEHASDASVEYLDYMLQGEGI